MKKSLLLTIAAALSFTAIDASAYDFEKDGIFYNKKTDTTVEVTFKDKTYGSYSGDVVIPSTVVYDDVTYTVASIGQYALRKCYNNLTSVVLPPTITTIGSAAFSEDYALTTITIPDAVTSFGTYTFNSCARLAEIKWGTGLTTIGTGAFMYCWSLTNVELPNSVKSLGQNAFQNCYNLKTVFIPASVTTIGQSAFKDCSRIEAITVDEANPNYSSSDGVLYNKKRTILIKYNNGRNVTSYSVPEGVDSLAYYSFATDSTLVEVTLPSSLKVIYNTAFYNAQKLEKVNVGQNVVTVGTQAFYGCPLKSITLPNSVATIGQQAFQGCTSLESVTIGSGITSVGNKAFYGSTAIKEINIGATTPPSAGTSCFDSAVYEAATLTVPANSIADYGAANIWKNFINIVASTATSIETIDAASNATPLYYVQPSGQVSKTPVRGINIVRMSDGSVKKVIEK